jgi:membrane protein required for colicin V production
MTTPSLDSVQSTVQAVSTGLAGITTVDWVLLAVLGVSMVIGALRGFLHEVLSLLSWVAALVLAQWFAAAMGAQLPIAADNLSMQYLAGFGVVFVLTLMVSGVLISLLKKLLSAVGLRPVDRILGAVFGLARGGLLLTALVLLLSRTPLHDQAAWRQSIGIGLLAQAVNVVVPWLPDDVRRYLPGQK